MPRKKQDWIEIKGWPAQIILYAFAGLLVWALLPSVFEVSFLTGIGFFIACAMSFYKGTVLKDPWIIAVIAIGYIMSNAIVGALIPEIYNSLISQSFLTAAILGIVFLGLYLKVKEMKDTGK